MSQEYREVLQQLLSLEYFGMKLGLENIRTLLALLDDPQRQLSSIHVAGTNGKGSVCSTLSAVLQSSGLKVGLFTSPHLVDYRERITINGVKIPEQDIAAFVERVWPTVQELRATFFEVTTALAFDHFRREAVDIAIIETGLGGRLDATNVLESPKATVITSIGLDHTQQLGNSLESIAMEKAGIFKRGVPAVVNVQHDLRTLFEDQAAIAACSLIHVDDYHLPAWTDSLMPSLAGEHQRQNLRTALVTLDILGYLQQPDRVRYGVEHVRELTGLQGRFQRKTLSIGEKRVELILDVAHNEDGIEAVVKHVHEIGLKPIVVVGAMRDKDMKRSLKSLAEVAQEIILVQPGTSRASTVEELMSLCTELGIEAVAGGSVAEGMSKALRLVKHGRSVLLLGSHYVVGEYLANESKIRPVVESEQ